MVQERAVLTRQTNSKSFQTVPYSATLNDPYS